MNKLKMTIPAIGLLIFIACAQGENGDRSLPKEEALEQNDYSRYSKAYFAAGCFWCVEAVFESVQGVQEVISGYAGGDRKDASYRKIGSGKTGHAESVEVIYDSTVVSYDTLLVVFFGSQDPTTLNRQGPDSGTQYRSAIFYRNEMELQKAKAYIQKLDRSGIYSKPIVTELTPFDAFYPAEDYHQNYEKLHPENPYVQSVSIPRLNKFKSKFPHLLKP